MGQALMNSNVSGKLADRQTASQPARARAPNSPVVKPGALHPGGPRFNPQCPPHPTTHLDPPVCSSQPACQPTSQPASPTSQPGPAARPAARTSSQNQQMPG